MALFDGILLPRDVDGKCFPRGSFLAFGPASTADCRRRHKHGIGGFAGRSHLLVAAETPVGYASETRWRPNAGRGTKDVGRCAERTSHACSANPAGRLLDGEAKGA